MTEEKKIQLEAAYQAFIDSMSMELPVEKLDEFVIPDVMGYGTTVDEKVFDLEGLVNIINLQEKQSENTNFKISFIPVHRKISDDENCAVYVDELIVSMQLEQGLNKFSARLSTVLDYIDGNWKIIHWHGSKAVETEGDTWHKEEWKQRNAELQKLVKEKTADLEKTLDDLKTTQAQLIHAEKMASLGELTAGIAHEIQNPLNFVNNFSEVSVDLIEEMDDEMLTGNIEEVKAIATDLKQNLKKIELHGKRASFIVKGMLDHSRADSGDRVPTDINILADEFLRLSYHGLRAKDKSFNAEIKTEFDEDLPGVMVIPQDFGRVLLNLINNAFYACAERSRSSVAEKQTSASTLPSAYKPRVTVSTKKENGNVVITVSDNGNGIPEDVKDKIFQPFFTTKPTGEGTGLGLSLSYDIITKGHNGTLKVNTKEARPDDPVGRGEGTEFIIVIPEK